MGRGVSQPEGRVGGVMAGVTTKRCLPDTSSKQEVSSPTPALVATLRKILNLDGEQ